MNILSLVRLIALLFFIRYQFFRPICQCCHRSQWAVLVLVVGWWERRELPFCVCVFFRVSLGSYHFKYDILNVILRLNVTLKSCSWC